MIVADKKRELILEKAVARFAHFGIHKTTMNEIADDLSMSKPSVYYYFPDKISLIVAVIERIFGEYVEKLAVLLDKATGVEEAIFSMLELRREFYQKYFMLHLGDNPHDTPFANADIKESIVNIRASEVLLLQQVLERAIKQEKIKSADAAHTAELFMDTLSGISVCVMAKQARQPMPDQKGFDEVLSKQKEVTHLFLKGLTRDDGTAN
ncbi:TetR/AcrR family transcriptional regulator [Paradesertivirga mongoliensis]|uniref:TetR/AcrR family transcriptional regulator n=1 Tax=Paradesertivirga mongoliensis TaxID=2100740 RepID=A0ABW4ZNZ3_9SPHI|nr:TetR/AcrR family transcriptional regulator [Pedobacter mongoliensis]